MWDDAWYLDKFDQHECCGCSLTHDVEYKIERGRIFTRWRVNEKATRAARRKLGIRVLTDATKR